jgi:toxin-antitoxin system PIN domain toxin
MTKTLLDLNVLLALAWPVHAHHDAAHLWFGANRSRGWATCPITQMGFLRLSMQPAIVKNAVSFSDALGVLEKIIAAPEHEFWSLDAPFSEIDVEILSRLAGHHQLADAMLLDLARRKKGTLATFDRRISVLLADEPSDRTLLEIIPARQ